MTDRSHRTRASRPLATAAAIAGALAGALAASLLPAGPALAQLRLPTLPGSDRLPTGDLVRRTDDLMRSSTQTLVPLDPVRWRERLADRLLRRYPDQLQRNAADELVFIGEVLALPSSDDARRALLARPGWRLVEEVRLDGLPLSWMRLHAPAGTSSSALASLIAQLRAGDPQGDYDYHHVYVDAGASPAPAREPEPKEPTSATPRATPETPPLPAPAERRVGMIDSGIDATHPALRAVALTRHGCGGEARPAAHGTAVASLLAGDAGADARADFGSALPGGRLFAVDVYCEGGKQAGGGVQAIAEGLAWLARSRVGVVNISLVGPPNALLRRVVEAAQAQGQLIVAPVGNDGPAAPPLFPAAWPGVIGVTGVDARRRVLAEAGRGPHVALAARGADLVAAESNGRGYVPVRGTSFAAPLVAGLLAARLPFPDRNASSAAFNALAREALDLGAPGRDEVYGLGLVEAPSRPATDGGRR
ncbi:S8 family serine peptidase [Roseateles sp. MS654]|uniref:S8 family serine peptidase n=1 Tax=Roseateles sp. MS654 TaxID=3412685 RepID=UPI003C2E1D11